MFIAYRNERSLQSFSVMYVDDECTVQPNLICPEAVSGCAALRDEMLDLLLQEAAANSSLVAPPTDTVRSCTQPTSSLIPLPTHLAVSQSIMETLRALNPYVPVASDVLCMASVVVANKFVLRVSGSLAACAGAKHVPDALIAMDRLVVAHPRASIR
jgi:hypothetical protein